MKYQSLILFIVAGVIFFANIRLQAHRTKEYDKPLKTRTTHHNASYNNTEYPDTTHSGKQKDYSQTIREVKILLASYENVLKMYERIRNLYPDSIECATELWERYMNAGDIYLDIGETKSALMSYEKMLKLAEELQNRNPDSYKFAEYIVMSYHFLTGYYYRTHDPKVDEAYQKVVESLTYMRRKNMYMDPPYVKLCEQLLIK